jgi:hypothetical protein
MLAFDILILATIFLRLVVLLLPHRKRPRWTNWLSGLIVLLIVVHVVLGRFRWQMAPTYGLGLLLSLLSVVRRKAIIRTATAQTSRKWRTAKIVGIVLGWLLFVFVARSAVVSPAFQPEKLEELKLLIERCPVGRPTKEDYSCVLPQVEDASIIFLGDSRHYIPEIKSIRLELGVFLAQHANVRVIGFESMYGLHPFMAAESMGKAETSDYVSSTILDYNTRVPDNSKVLVTALDVDHSINHSKSKTVKYFEYLAALSSSDKCVTELKQAIPKLLSLKERGELHRYLDGLETTFSQYRDTFSAEDWDEVSFSLELMHASVDFQLITYKWQRVPLSRKMRIRLHEIRAEFFRKTVERAFAKASERKGKLLCIVGGAHIVKGPLGKGNSLIGKWAEADYFHRIHADTQGKVASILVNALSFKGQPYEKKNDLDDIAYEMLADGELLYIPLAALANHSEDLAWSEYFSSHGPRFDGVIFLRKATWPSK